MSIEQKIAELLAESKKLQAEEQHNEEISEEEISEEGHIITEEQFEALSEEEQAEYELVQQIDEISNTTLRSYMSKAYASGEKAKARAKAHKVLGNDSEAAKEKSTADKRKNGFVQALARDVGQRGHANDIDGASKRLKKHVSAMPSSYKEEVELQVDVSEDVAALVNGEELSEEFKTKAATIFEAAVLTRVKAEVAKIEEEFDSKLAQQVEEIKEGLVEKVDGYLNYVVEQWMTDNELALENGMKADIMESFVAGMKNLFMEHYIEVPAEKYDLVGELEEEVETTKSKLDEQLAANVELTKQINEMKRVSSIGEFCADLADTDAEKFKGLAEELAFEDAESFKTKLQTIKENYFGKKAPTSVSSVVTDDPVQLDEETKTVDPVMAQYLAALK